MMKCSCCDVTEDIQMHHLYPKSQGCPDDLMVPLCYKCHRKAHGLETDLNHSELTKAGLQRAKERGVQLGGLRQRTADANRVAVAQADEFADKIKNILMGIKIAGTYQAMADELNYMKIPTRRGGKWHPTTVKNLLARLELDGKK